MKKTDMKQYLEISYRNNKQWLMDCITNEWSQQQRGEYYGKAQECNSLMNKFGFRTDCDYVTELDQLISVLIYGKASMYYKA